MDREDKILNMIHDAVLWIFLGFMVAVLCISAAREKKNSAYIAELEQQIQVLESTIKDDNKKINSYKNELDDLTSLYNSTSKQYLDRIQELEGEIERYRENENATHESIGIEGGEGWKIT